MVAAAERYFFRARTFLRAAELALPEVDSFTLTLQAPVLALLGHAFELYFKGVLIGEGGKDGVFIKTKIGHDLIKAVGEPALANRKAYFEGEGYWNMFVELAHLHSSQSDYALRYPTDTPTMALSARALCVFAKQLFAQQF